MVATDFDTLRSHFDHTEADHAERMDEEYAHLRASCPVARSDKHGGFWVLSRYDDIREALQRAEVFASGQGITIPPIGNPVPGIPTESDDPLHAEYRNILWPFLTAQAVAAYESSIRSALAEIFDGIDLEGEIDVVGELAQPIPAIVIGLFFGIGAEDGLRCFRWINTMISSSADEPDRAQRAAEELFGFLHDLVDSARKHGADGVIGAIATAEIDGRSLSAEECMGLMFTAIGGALETTASAITQMFYLLGIDSEARARLVADPDLVPRAVEEILRVATPAHAPARTVVQETTIHGCPMNEGDRVLLLLRSANHDERQFDEPDVFKVDRTPNQHLTFGSGVHKCAGQHLARLELRVVLAELLRRMPNYDIVGTPRPTMRGGATFGLDELRIRLTPQQV